MKDKLKRLEAIARQASVEHIRVRDEFAVERARKIAIVDATLRPLYEQRFADTAAALEAARRVVIAEKDRLAKLGVGAPHPVGTAMVEWRDERPFSGGAHLTPTGRTGVMEACTRETRLPGNLGRFNAVAVGEYFIRLRKKDGTLGMAVEARKWNITNRWFPENVDPRKKGDS